jgi:actin-like ATPase involved in cell morphogenesis
MSLILKIANVIYRIFLSCTTNNTNKITPDEFDMYIQEYVKKHPEIMIERSKDL